MTKVQKRFALLELRTESAEARRALFKELEQAAARYEKRLAKIREKMERINNQPTTE